MRHGHFHLPFIDFLSALIANSSLFATNFCCELLFFFGFYVGKNAFVYCNIVCLLSKLPLLGSASLACDAEELSRSMVLMVSPSADAMLPH